MIWLPKVMTLNGYLECLRIATRIYEPYISGRCFKRIAFYVGKQIKNVELFLLFEGCLYSIFVVYEPCYIKKIVA